MKKKKIFRMRILSFILATTMIIINIQSIGAIASENSNKSSSFKGTVNKYEKGVGTAYYVDSINGDDNNEGISEGKPFKSLKKVNEIYLKPGDSILLKKGSIFDDQQLTPKGRGTEKDHILIGSYGSGDKMPIINANRKFLEAILIENMEYVDITGIEVTNDDAFNLTDKPDDPNNNRNNWDRRLGIHVAINEKSESTFSKNTERVWKGINIDGCYIHDVDGDENRNTNKLSGGIGVEIKFTQKTTNFPYFDGVTIQNNRIHKVDRTGIKGVRLTELGEAGEDKGGDNFRYANIRRKEKNQVSYNYVVRNNNMSDIGGDGILVDSTKGALIEHNLLYNHTMRGQGANAGIWSWNTFDATFRYNESYGGPLYNQDGCSYDSDYNSAGTIFEYNYSHDTPMGFMLLMGGNDTDIIRYNISQNDGLAFRHIAGNSNTPSYIYNNVFYYDGANWQFIHNNNPDGTREDSLKSNWQWFNNIYYNYNKEVPTNWKKTKWTDALKMENEMVYEASGKSGKNELPNAIKKDPKFINPGGGKTDNWESLKSYQLREDSPAIGRGSYVNVVPKATSANNGFWDSISDRNIKNDFYGNELYQGAPDIGVHEVEKSSLSFDIEKNASYRIMNVQSKSYLENTEGRNIGFSNNLGDNQEFTFIGTKDGYKIRIWNTEDNTYLYLNSKGILSETDDTVWTIEDLKTGFYHLKANGKYLTKSENGLVMLDKLNSDNQKWHLKLVSHSTSFNSGGEEIEGYSKDQESNDNNKQSGYYGEVSKLEKNISKEEINNTALTGKEFGYKFFVGKGNYNVKLNFAELEGLKNRTFDILINGNPYKEGYVLDSDTKVEEIGQVYAVNGVIDIKLVSAYNSDRVETNPILSGISLTKNTMSEVNMRINAGGKAFDGLSEDAQYPTKGSGYYGESTKSLGDFDKLPIPDAGMGTVLKTGREGENFGYKFKVQPGEYRVKMYFNEGTISGKSQKHTFNIKVNGKVVKENFNIIEAAGGADKAVDVTLNAVPQNGVLDIGFEGVNGEKAMVNAIIVEPYEQSSEENLAKNKNVVASSEENSDKAASNAVDGNNSTRWGSKATDTEWIYVDLGQLYSVNEVVVDWTPGAYATQYRIEISEDGEKWSNVKTVREAMPGLNSSTLDSEVARYVRISGEERNDKWGISLTELEVYGTEVRGEAKTIVETTEEKDGNHTLSLGTQNIYKRYKTMEIKLSYNPNLLEYVGNETYNKDLLALIGNVEKEEISESNHILKYRFSIKNADALIEYVELMKALFKPKTENRTFIDTTVSLTNVAGHITELKTVKAYIPNQVSMNDMRALIKEANDLYNNSEVGNKPGQYTQEAKDKLHESIKRAEKVNDETSKEERQKEYLELEKALNEFKESVKKAKYVNYHKDYMVDKSGNYSNGDVNVVDGKLQVRLGANQSATDNDAPGLKEGYLYTRFSVDNAGDQTLFRVKNSSGTGIRIGYDEGAKSWFYDSAKEGYGYFGGNPLRANEEHEMIMEYRLNDSNKYNLTLWINGQKLKTIENLSYDAVDGVLTLETRRNAKTFNINEVYVTNSEKLNIQVTNGEGGTVSQTGNVTTFKEADKTFFITPNDGYEIDKVLVDGVETNIKDNKYTFEYLQNNHKLDVTFKKISEVPDEKPDQGEEKIYHQDFSVDKEINYDGNLLSKKEIKDNALNITLGSGSDNNFAIAEDKNAKLLDSGVFYARFTVDSIADQTFFDVMKSDSGFIRVGFDYDPNSNRAAWFWDKANNKGGYGDFPVQGAPLEVGKEHEIKISFKKDASNLYSVSLVVDGKNLGTVDGLDYNVKPGTFAFGARRVGKTYSVKETYYTQTDEVKLTVNAGENGTVTPSGDFTSYVGANKTVKFMPKEGYELDKIILDGKEVKAEGDTYTIKNISSNHKLQITFKEKDLVNKVDKTELKDLYNEAIKLQSSDYTSESFMAFKKALNSAKDVIDNENATINEVTNALNNLKEAIDNLVINNPNPTPEPEDPEKPEKPVEPEKPNGNDTNKPDNNVNNESNNENKEEINDIPETGGVVQTSVLFAGIISSLSGLAILKKRRK
ncbi:F5/8 type C domain protein [Clostridium baratii str. Sullivan]|uniref:F5/8 type C domain protein n=1 Tax=Clostridium baratii str. Sullivan TaxID=1415775 RepID=A0A0A7G287_9CLOT|nr:malectin domain-containing carbohydrate-binding protein [Clostridium baratii]AIY85170.1 F5/8 type C domain protein [Clostridium baratii str. Sullivan]